MDVGNVYMVRNKLESDVGDAVDVTGITSVFEDAGTALRQPARKNTISTKLKTVPDFILLLL